MVNETLIRRAYRLLAGGLDCEDAATIMQPKPGRHLTRAKRRRANAYVYLAISAAAVLARDVYCPSTGGTTGS
jgi:hypothetical protein